MARSLVRDVLTEAGLRDLADEAMILTTELATTGVLRTGTAMELDVVGDAAGVTVTLSDPIRDPGRRGTAETTVEPPRGLNLIDTLASSWGTSYNSRGKSVWFRLDAAGGAPAEPATAAEPAPAAPEPVPPAMPDDEVVRWLTYLPEKVARRLNKDEMLRELLRRLTETIGADHAVLWLDEGLGAPPRAVTFHGLAEPPDAPRELPDDEPDPAVATSREAAAAASLLAAGAVETIGIRVPFGQPQRGILDLGASREGAFDDGAQALALLSAERMALVVDAARVRETESRRRGFLVFLAEASELLANSLDVDLTLVLIAQLCVTRLGRWCVIHTPDERGRPELAATAHADEREVRALQKHFVGGQAEPVEERLRAAVQTRSVVKLPDEVAGVVVPLTARRHVVGTMSIGEPLGRRHTPEEVAIAEDLGRRAGLALDNARLYQERDAVAAGLQQGLLPASLPVVAGLDFGARYAAAGDGNEVGGDFYDVLGLDGDRWLLAIGDVCGKGPQAASITGLVRDVIRVLVREGRPLPYVLSALNTALLDQGERARFCTVAAAVAERHDSLVRVELCLAGHLMPAVLRANGVAELVGDIGIAVGIFDAIDVQPVQVDLHPGDALIFYTDGVTERRDGADFFGDDNLLMSLRECVGLDASGIAAHLQETVVEFGDDPARDDIAVLVLRHSP
jgi:sigma-B regulation protein RsbU (phosphoserine phosphatase)